MANNRIYEPGWKLPVVVTHPLVPVSGEAVRFGTLTGVALVDEAGGGNAAGETTVDFGPGVWLHLVDDDGGGGIAVGDAIYFHDAATGPAATSHLNNNATAMDAYFGVALAVVGAGLCIAIPVLHVPLGATTSLGALAVTAGMLGTAAVLDESKLGPIMVGSGDGLGVLRAARFTFDPSAVAGHRTIAAHGLGVTLPDNAVVLGGYIEILTTFADGVADAATIALSVEGANDLVTATAISSGTFWDAVKGKVIVPTALEASGVATSIKTSAAREITATVGGVALTAGTLHGWLFYVIGG